MPARTSLTVEQRIRARIPYLAPDVCWPWQGTVNAYTGYGQFSYRDHTQGGRVIGLRAHRAVYELLVGAVPDGLTIDHLCGVKTCVNPAHLEPVTGAENTRRGVAAHGGRVGAAKQRAAQTHCKWGHEFTPENTYVQPNGTRACKACRRGEKSGLPKDHPTRRAAMAAWFIDPKRSAA